MRLLTIAVLLTVVIAVAAVHLSLTNFSRQFQDEFMKYRDTRERSPLLEELLRVSGRSAGIVTIEELPEASYASSCLRCWAIGGTFLTLFSNDTERNRAMAMDLCLLHGSKRFVCEGLIGQHADLAQFILENRRPALTVESLCAIARQGHGCGPRQPVQLFEDEPFVDVPLGPPSTQRPLTILHLSDIHYDPGYAVGVNVKCGAAICCRVLEDLQPPVRDDLAAGYWGDYRNCDSPWHAVVDVIQQIKRQHPHLDAVYFTGDIVDHHAWNTSQETVEESLRQVFDLFKRNFPGVPVYPILGNHDIHPANLFAPESGVPRALSSAPLYEFIADQWSTWLSSDVNIRRSLLAGGYYTTLTPFGLRIIGLNNNVCYTGNFWLLYSADYFMTQLHWLRQTLASAEASGELVHILAHVPSNDLSCYAGWTRQYRTIVERYAHIIRAQFNGHTHLDEVNIFYRRTEPKTPIAVAWNGGSSSTFTRLNPNYKLFQIDRQTFVPLDIETWSYNLTEANLDPNQAPRWQLSYSFRDFHRLPDLRPPSLGALVQRLNDSDNLLADYWAHGHKQADPHLNVGCNRRCLRRTFCALVRTDLDQTCR